MANVATTRRQVVIEVRDSPFDGGSDVAARSEHQHCDVGNFDLKLPLGDRNQATGALQLAIRLAEQTSLNRNPAGRDGHPRRHRPGHGGDHGAEPVRHRHRVRELRRASQNRNIKLWHVAADILTAVTGAPATPSPPVTQYAITRRAIRDGLVLLVTTVPVRRDYDQRRGLS